MSQIVLLNTRVFVGGADLSADTNNVELASSVDDVDVTTFADAPWKKRLGGLKDTTGSVAGIWDAGDPSQPDDQLFANLGGVVPWTVCPDGASVGNVAYFTSMLETSYDVGGNIGDAFPFTADGSGANPLVRGAVLADAGTARTATGTGSVVQLGAVTTGQKMWVAVHVVSASGTTPSITVQLQSSTVIGFGAPTVRATLAAATTNAGLVGSVVGPVTDTYWRLAWTIAGTTPSFLILGVAGVAS